MSNTAELIHSLNVIKGFCLEPETINDAAVFIEACNVIKQAVRNYAEEEDSPYITREVEKFPLFTVEEVEQLANKERTKLGSLATLPFIKNEFTPEKITGPFKTLFKACNNIIYIIENPDAELEYNNIIEHPGDTIININCKPEPYWLRLLRANKYLSLLFLASIVFEIWVHREGFLLLLLVAPALAVMHFLFEGSFSRPKFQLTRLVATQQNFYIKYFEYNSVKEQTLAWNDFIIVTNYYKDYITRERFCIMRLVKNNDTFFHIYDGMGTDLKTISVSTLIWYLKNVQQAVKMVREDEPELV